MERLKLKQLEGVNYLGVVGNAVPDGAEVVEREEDACLGGAKQEERDGESREQKRRQRP